MFKFKQHYLYNKKCGYRSHNTIVIQQLFSPVIRIFRGRWYSIISGRCPIWLLLLLLLLTVRLVSLLSVCIVAIITHGQYLYSSGIPFKRHRRIVRRLYEHTIAYYGIRSLHACTETERESDSLECKCKSAGVRKIVFSFT